MFMLSVEELYLIHDALMLFKSEGDDSERLTLLARIEGEIIKQEDIEDTAPEEWLTRKPSMTKYDQEAGYVLSESQKRFARKAKKEGFPVDYNYSGRGMFGRRCPAVRCNAGEFGYKGAAQDQMRKGVVIYMPN